MPILHLALPALLITLVVTAYNTSEELHIHLMIMGGLAIALWASITW